MNDCPAYDNQLVDLLFSSKLFKGLTKKSIISLLDQGKIIELDDGEVFAAEGDLVDNFALIVSGSIKVGARDTDDETYQINVIEAGSPIGEMYLYGEKFRIATVHAQGSVKLWIIDADIFKRRIKTESGLMELPVNIGKIIIQRLKSTNNFLVKSKRIEVALWKKHTSMANFLMFVIFLLSIMTLSIFVLRGFISHVISTNLISTPFLVLMAALSFIAVKKSHLNFSDFGFNTKNWQRAIVEAVAISAVFIGIIILVKWFVIYSNPHLSQTPLFEPLRGMRTLGVLSPLELKILTSMLYFFIAAPLQEIIVRGLFQSSLQDFILSKHKVLYAIILSNMVFAVSHLLVSIQITIVSFVLGLLWGWMYARHKTLIGVLLCHSLIGVAPGIINLSVMVARVSGN